MKSFNEWLNLREMDEADPKQLKMKFDKLMATNSHNPFTNSILRKLEPDVIMNRLDPDIARAIMNGDLEEIHHAYVQSKPMGSTGDPEMEKMVKDSMLFKKRYKELESANKDNPMAARLFRTVGGEILHRGLGNPSGVRQAILDGDIDAFVKELKMFL